MNWFDGGMEPARPKGLPNDAPMGTGGEGVIYTGDHGRVMTAYMGENPRVIAADGKVTLPYGAPVTTDAPFRADRPEWGGSASGADTAHFLEWVEACHGGPAARASYAYEAPIVETLLLGCIAVRTHEVLDWDAENFRFAEGSQEATALLKPAYRSPYGL